jgi:hypothetical protein
MKKEHILQEIRRTAEANGGAPLGYQKFTTETGIKKYDWMGVFWARWSEALKEAGFAANDFQSAYDKAELLERYATLAQELGRLPSDSDIRLKARSDADFPANTTFSSRFGAKSELVAQLVEYCRTRTGYEDVVRYCQEYAPPKRHMREEAAAQEEDFGFVYLIKSGRFYKLGRTNSAGRRERELAIQLPEKAKTVHVIRTDDPCGIEAYWHKRFEPKRKNGEWFELDAADVAAFKRRKFM